jgi:hypothetical protein
MKGALMRFTFAIISAALSFGLSGVTHAQQAAPVAPMPVIYVGEFQPAEAPSSGFGPLHSLTSTVHTHRLDENAAKLSGSIVRALKNHNVSAEALPSDVTPSSGWIVRGVFYSLDSDSHLISIPFLRPTKGPNVEVTVTIADAAKDPDTPFAVIGTDAVLKGQNSPIGWNPYVVAARFAIHTVESDRSMESWRSRSRRISSITRLL